MATEKINGVYHTSMKPSGGSSAGAVRYDTSQSLNITQKERARANIDAQSIIQASTLLAASLDLLDKVYQFTGATDENYTNGYFYKCVSDGAATPTYSWSRINVQPSGSAASGAVVYDEQQSLTNEQKSQARSNIGAMESKTIDSTPTANSANLVTSGGVKTALDEKQNTINDLSTIRSGAQLGATALQSVPDAYRTASAQDAIDATKQPMLTAGENITIVNNVISAAGGGGTISGAVRYDSAQSLTDGQKSQARGNIGIEEYTSAEVDTLWNSIS